MESKYQRYNEGIVNKISESLSIYRSASDAAREMGIDVSGLIKHIKKYRIIKETLEIKNLPKMEDGFTLSRLPQ